MRNIFILPALAFTILSAFNNNPMSINNSKKQYNEVTTLDSIKWRLTGIYNADSFVEAASTKAFIQFNTADGRVNGNGSCNSFDGKLVIDGNNLKLGNTFSTKMYCNEVQSIENEFFNQLQKVTRYEIKDKKLLLYEDAKLLLEFEG